MATALPFPDRLFDVPLDSGASPRLLEDNDSCYEVAVRVQIDESTGQVRIAHEVCDRSDNCPLEWRYISAGEGSQEQIAAIVLAASEWVRTARHWISPF